LHIESLPPGNARILYNYTYVYFKNVNFSWTTVILN